jgi:hypothetical protein
MLAPRVGNGQGGERAGRREGKREKYETLASRRYMGITEPGTRDEEETTGRGAVGNE